MKVNKITNLLGTFFLLGYLPVAPGTWGSLGGVIIFLLFSDFPFVLFFITAALFFAGVHAARLIAEATGKHDPSEVVIDEVVGMLITYFFIPLTLLNIAAGFVLFRIFDVIKPPPIRKLEKIPRGWGIMLDDVLAGVYANLVLQIIARIVIK